jgi:hypothetical protein
MSAPKQRQATGGAVISLRRDWLRPRLTDLGVGLRFLLLQGERCGELLPALRPPLVLDTVGLEPTLLAAVLAELHEACPPLPTLALVASDDYLAQRLVPLCAAIAAVVADTQLAWVPLLLRDPGLVSMARPAAVAPATLGVSPPPRRGLEPAVLGLLAALPTARTVTEAATLSRSTPRTVYRRLHQARVALDVTRSPGTKRLTPPELATKLIAALRRWPDAEVTPTARARGDV